MQRARSLGPLGVMGFVVVTIVPSGAAWAQSQPTVDGNLADIASIVTQINTNGLPAFGVNQLDNIANGAVVCSDGFGDEPLDPSATPQGALMHSPVNVGRTYLIYKPDSDGVIGTGPGFAADDSWLALGIDIANGNGDVVDTCSGKALSPPGLPSHIMVPFDSDGNGHPGTVGTGAASRWAPLEPVPAFGERNDALNLFFLTCASDPDDFQTALPEVTIIYEQLFDLATNLRVLRNGIDVGPPAANFPISVAPANSSTTASIAARGLNGTNDDDFEFLINKVDSKFSLAFPGEDFATVTRFRLAQLGMLLSSDSAGDLSNEDTMFLLINLAFPAMRVNKQVRCEGETVWHEGTAQDPVNGLPGSTLEYRIEIENTGNTALGVTLEDVLSSALCSVDPVPGSLVATLFRPGDAAGQVVNFDNAATFNPPFNADFFNDPLSPGEEGFLTNLDGTPTFLGILKGVDICDNPADPALGDRIVITFKATVPDDCAACTGNVPRPVNDVVNTVTVIGDPDATEPPTVDGDEIEATDATSVNLQCRDIEFSKTASATVLQQAGPFPFNLTYTYSVKNDGELVESATVRDSVLCGDVNNNAGIPGLDYAAPGVATTCPICVNPANGVSSNVNPSGGTFTTTCTLTFSSAAAVTAFLAADDARNPQQGDPAECTGGTGDPLCHTNRATLSVRGANLPDGCNDDDVFRACETVCSGCNLNVTKSVACVDEQTGQPGPFQDALETTLPGERMRFRMEACNTGTPVELVCITDTLLASCRTWVVPNSLTCRIEPCAGGASRPATGLSFAFAGARVCYDVTGNPDTRAPLAGGEKLVCEFDVLVPGAGSITPGTAVDCSNNFEIDGYLSDAVATPPSNTRDCNDSDATEINVQLRDVDFDKSVTARNAAGALDPNELPTFPASVFPIFLDYTYKATNSGELAEVVKICDNQLCVDAPAGQLSNCPICADVAAPIGTPDCVVLNPTPATPPSPALGVGEMGTTTCTVRFDDAAELAAFLGKDDARTSTTPECDGTAPADCGPDPRRQCYRNRASMTVDGASITPQCDQVFTCEECATVCAGCNLEVVKGVKCADDPDSGYFPSKVALPGEELTFRFTVMNTGVPIERLCLTDTLSCRATWSPTAPVCTIQRADGSNDPYPAPPVNGARTCVLLPEPLAMGDKLVCTFNVTVPPDFAQVNVNPDCINTIDVDGYIDGDTSITAPPDCEDESEASVDVKVADIDCVEKEAEATDNKGDTFGPASFLDIESQDSSYPITLTYRVTVRNPSNSSEVPLLDVKICDEAIVNAAEAAIADGANLTLGPCDFNNAERCKAVASLAVGATEVATCTLTINDADAWRNFACREAGNAGATLIQCLAGELEVDAECFHNKASVSGVPDYGFDTGDPNQPCVPANPPDGGRISDDSNCEAEVCVRPPSECTCTKATFTIWNENEVKFSGTHRCLCDWDQEWISEYDAPNHMLRTYLQTNKGKARIDAIASPVVCDPLYEDVLSVDAPLLGVAAKQISFQLPSRGMGSPVPAAKDSAGMSLVGIGVQEGKITYELPAPGGPEERAESEGGFAVSRLLDGPQRVVRSSTIEPAAEPLAGPDMASPMASRTTQKGSLLVYPKVELKWRGDRPDPGMLIQDTFLTLMNDFPDDVIVYMYFVAKTYDDRCDAWVDSAVTLTNDHPVYWSSASGGPQTPPPVPVPPGSAPLIQVPPFPSIGRGFFTEPDPMNPGQVITTLRGYVLAWAVGQFPADGGGVRINEIHWNHLSGLATIVNYVDSSAWEYNAWAFQAKPSLPTGSELPGSAGILNLDGADYDWAPDQLLFDFYSSGSRLTSDRDPNKLWPTFTVDTDLTLWPAIKDLRR